MFRYRYIPHCVKLIVSSRGRDSASSADAGGSGRHADGCKLYPSGAAVYPHYAEGCCFFFIRARGLAQPVERYTPALVMCLYAAMFGMKKKHSVWKHELFNQPSSV